MENRDAIKSDLIQIFSEDLAADFSADQLADLALKSLHLHEMTSLKKQMEEWETAQEGLFESLIVRGSATQENKQLLENFGNWDADLQSSNRTAEKPTAKVRRIGGTRRIWLVAASILLLAVSWFVINLNGGANSGKLFSEFYSDYPHSRTFRGDDNTANVLATQTFTQYDQKNYEAASTGFENLIAVNPSDIDLHLYLGICYLQLDKYPSALQAFSTYSEENNTAFHGIWYQGLTYLKMGNKEEARTLFTLLASTGNTFYQNKANEILEDL